MEFGAQQAVSKGRGRVTDTHTDSGRVMGDLTLALSVYLYAGPSPPRRLYPVGD